MSSDASRVRSGHQELAVLPENSVTRRAVFIRTQIWAVPMVSFGPHTAYSGAKTRGLIVGCRPWTSVRRYPVAH